MVDLERESYCRCASDYYLRGRTDPECRCDDIKELIDVAVAEARKAVFEDTREVIYSLALQWVPAERQFLANIHLLKLEDTEAAK